MINRKKIRQTVIRSYTGPEAIALFDSLEKIKELISSIY